jgi:excisionase family DNA binding protein
MGEWVTYPEACVKLGLSKRQIQRLVKNGAIESKLDGRKKYIKVSGSDKGDIGGVTLIDSKGDAADLFNDNSNNDKSVVLDDKGDIHSGMVTLVDTVNILASEIVKLTVTVDKLANELSKKKRWFRW